MNTLFWKLYQTGEYADLIVTCQGRIFDVHKAIVCSQCPFFAQACDKQEKAGQPNVKHNPRDRIDLPDEDPNNIARLIQFCYLGNYSDGEHYDELPTPPALMDADEIQKNMLLKDPDSILSMEFEEDDSTIATNGSSVWEEEDTEEDEEEYGDEPLEDGTERWQSTENPTGMATDEGARNIPYETAISTSMQMYIIADKYQVPGLRLLAQQRIMLSAQSYLFKLDNFIEVIEDIFERIEKHDPLRRFLCNIISDRYFADKDTRDRLRPIIEKHLDFAMFVLESVVGSLKSKEKEKPADGYSCW